MTTLLLNSTFTYSINDNIINNCILLKNCLENIISDQTTLKQNIIIPFNYPVDKTVFDMFLNIIKDTNLNDIDIDNINLISDLLNMSNYLGCDIVFNIIARHLKYENTKKLFVCDDIHYKISKIYFSEIVLKDLIENKKYRIYEEFEFINDKYLEKYIYDMYNCLSKYNLWKYVSSNTYSDNYSKWTKQLFNLPIISEHGHSGFTGSICVNNLIYIKVNGWNNYKLRFKY